MTQTNVVSSMLFVSVLLATGPWQGSAIGSGELGPTVQCRGVARVELHLDRAAQAWWIEIDNLSDQPIEIDVDARFRPFELAGPIRVEPAPLPEGALPGLPTGRVITRSGGVVNGQRIDADADAWFRDRFRIGVPAGARVVVGARIAACEPADLDGNGAVDSADLAACLGAWGATNVAADINRDGIVDAVDLAALVGAFTPHPTQVAAELAIPIGDVGNDATELDPLTIDAPPPDPTPTT